jgi:hypothetical protein
MSDRRETLKIIGAIGSTCAFPYSADELYGQHAHDAPAAALPSKPSFFNPAEFEAVSKLAELIVPGAGAAAVPMYIDYVVASSERWKRVYRQGLRGLDKQASAKHGKPFAALAEAEQIVLLTPLCDAADRITKTNKGTPEAQFFKAVKSMTADGFWTSKQGLVDTLGYKGNTVLAEFPTCEHEH